MFINDVRFLFRKDSSDNLEESILVVQKIPEITMLKIKIRSVRNSFRWCAPFVRADTCTIHHLYQSLSIATTFIDFYVLIANIF